MPEVTLIAHDIGPVGGMEIVLSRLIQGLAANGWRVTVIARSCAIDESANVRVIRVPGPGRPFVLAYPWFALAASVLLARHGRGIVHATGAIVLGRVDVISVHLVHRAPAVRHGSSRASRGTLAYRAHARVAAWLSRAGEHWCYRRSRARAFVAVSPGVAGELRELFPSVTDGLVVIPNGVDSDVFRPDPAARATRADLGLPVDGLVALFVGSEWERKGLRAAVQAMTGAAEWHLGVLGSGDTRSYRELARGAGVADRVHFLGASGDVARYYRAADAFLLPTRYETFSLATYEAAASGLPLLATDVSGIRDLIDDGVNGFLIQPNADLIADRLRTLGAEPSLRAAMGHAARRASLGFGWPTTIASHEALYSELGANANGSPVRERVVRSRERLEGAGSLGAEER